jgi:stage V sporulation protein SpoVS
MTEHIENIENLDEVDEVDVILGGTEIITAETAETAEKPAPVAFVKKFIKTNKPQKTPDSLKVAADPDDLPDDERKKAAKRLAGAIAHALRNDGEITLRSFGRAAVAKAIKSLSIADKYLKDTDGLKLSFAPAFISTVEEGKTLTGIGFCAFTIDKDSQPVNLDTVEAVLKVKPDPENFTQDERREAARKLGGAIAHYSEQNGECLVRAFGRSALMKAAKSIVIARTLVAAKGLDLYCWSDFISAEMSGKMRTGYAFYCYTNG